MRSTTSKAQGDVELTNYGQYLDCHKDFPYVEIAENTAWSCAHGIGSLDGRLRLQHRP